MEIHLEMSIKLAYLFCLCISVQLKGTIVKQFYDG